jgi:SAM-dependent methyltransferase
MADAIEAFYTEHPYPPPVTNLDRVRDEWRGDGRDRAEFHLFWPDRPFRADLDILVAGCGTWQAAKYSLCRPAARVTGIDVSSTSLDHTERLKRQYDLTNLDTRQLAIEDASQLQRQFDLIVCTGVLHHLADPDAGLRALSSVLKPGGVMYLMLYAPFGRTGIYMLQEYCRMLGIGTSASEIRDLVGSLNTLPQHHPLAAVLRTSRDALDADALADALLNPRERSYSVPQLFEFLERNGLRFDRWYWQAPYLPHCGAIATTPHAARLAALPARHQYAAMELWRGTMTAHSVLVRAGGGAPNPAVGAGFDGARWLDYIPVRLPAAICVQERLPPGAAGVLLNRSHAQHDLILPITSQQKDWVDAIDGRRTVRQIAGCDAARPFFKTLWRFDQVVFDTSAAHDIS